MDIKLNEKYSGVELPEVIISIHGVKTFRYVPYNIVLNENKLYTWNYILIGPSSYNYEGVVKAIINVKYNNDSMTAILNNYLLSPDNEKYKKEFNEMQEWRLYAKNFSKQHFGIE